MSDLLQFLIAGGAAGLLAGLFGVGGGLVMVPVLALVFASQVSGDAVLPLALGTSLAAIVFSAASSAWGHHRRGAVDVALIRRALPMLAAGAAVGAFGAAWAPHALLTALLALFQASVCVMMVRKTYYPEVGVGVGVEVAAAAERAPSNPLLGVIGGVCALAGIGGGTLCVPYFTHLGISPRKAVGTAAALGVPIALAAACAFAAAGWLKGVDLTHSVGYVH
ncbi:MAG TPA: sulfite exporter TauE/SafE family protein, partial [Burkholderiaceae bacterium]|nr:sulfite exporter TauE/SafE family protein [Burkholderiaceae bacterium]